MVLLRLVTVCSSQLLSGDEWPLGFQAWEVQGHLPPFLYCSVVTPWDSQGGGV